MERAERDGAKAAADAGVEIVECHTAADSAELSELIGRVWPVGSGASLVEAGMVRALGHAGNYVVLARRGGESVGGCLGFRGVDDEGVLLHSHIAGVIPGLEGRHVGLALKLHQREWSLSQGLPRITWTFDPLVARNAYFNVTKLGAELSGFEPDFYGPMDDGLNRGSPSDRCHVTWRLSEDPPLLPVNGAPEVLRFADDGTPELVGDVLAHDRVICRIPSDIVLVREQDPELALAWRMALRAVFEPAYASGRRVLGVRRDGAYLVGTP